jgi:N-acetylmuramoyl-L-alanine amidase
MRVRRGALATSAGSLALVVLGGPMLPGPALAAGPSVVVRWGDTLGAIAARYGTSVVRLVNLNHIANPDLIFPGQIVRLAAGSRNKASRSGPTSSFIVHVVRSGETLSGLAVHYGTTMAALMTANGLANPNRIIIGERLRVPVSTPAQRGTAGTVASRTAVHVVRAGETLTGIARRNGTSVAALLTLNHLPRSGLIRVGQRLQVPVSRRSGATGWTTARFPPTTRALMARRAETRGVIVDEARRAGVPVSLALAVAWQESGWREHVVSSAGAVGVMQLLPSTADWIAESMLQAPVNIYGRRSNIRAGVTLLKHYLLRYRGDQRRALAAYYQGQAAVDRNGIFPVSEAYIASILLLEDMFQP